MKTKIQILKVAKKVAKIDSSQTQILEAILFNLICFTHNISCKDIIQDDLNTVLIKACYSDASIIQMFDIQIPTVL